MITANFKRKHNKIFSFKISGHAGYKDPGYDIVCSAVSAISLSIANGITDILYIEPLINTGDGLLSLDLSHVSCDQIEKCQILLETMLLGIKTVENEYGKYIKVVEEEV
ncbi:ribosomal-processing cysteine protease Prp [Hathewaya histolytica]|uniref:Ribosomal processing cysteine protease Prp n=1 Tax=Hathewaya histolytica TaxID=1498 RepID=A0A4U9RJQ6_HATHI|nr:ribosomal-processing cysteine protease Prp [Hathewaya histolytica]VTQ90823.1 putative ribosomal protein [Hathewaya histolytica]